MAALIIGEKSRPLAPDLAQLLAAGDRCWLYTSALARMGEDGVAPLASALTNPDEKIRRDARGAIQATTARLDAALPALVAASTNIDCPDRDEAAAILDALRTRNPAYTNRQGLLETDIFGNGKYEF
jgi:hypothetical protein